MLGSRFSDVLVLRFRRGKKGKSSMYMNLPRVWTDHITPGKYRGVFGLKTNGRANDYLVFVPGAKKETTFSGKVVLRKSGSSYLSIPYHPELSRLLWSNSLQYRHKDNMYGPIAVWVTLSSGGGFSIHIIGEEHDSTTELEGELPEHPETD